MSEQAEAEDHVEAAASEPSVEERAQAMGWVPKDRFKGPPEQFVEAETYVRKAETVMPLIRRENQRLETALKDSQKEVAKLQKAVEGAIQHISKAEQRAYERAEKEIQARIDTAAEAGDVQAVRDATEELVGLTKDAKSEAKPEATTDDAADARQAFIDANPWYSTDRVMRAFANDLAAELQASGLTDPAKQLAEVAKQVKAEFPEKFENPNRRQAAAVEGAGTARGRAAKSYADLPAEAKQMCDEFCRDIKGFTREKYVREYFANEAR